jgi:hypothetical protein
VSRVSCRRPTPLLVVFAVTGILTFTGDLLSASDQSNPLDPLALKAVYALGDADKKNVVVLDLTTADGQWLTFGSWLADQLSASLAIQGQPTISMLDRNKIPAAAAQLNLVPADELNLKNQRAMAKALGANTLIVGSYGVVGNDLAATIAAFRVADEGPPIVMVNARIRFSEAVRTRLNVTFDSLRPKRGIYTAGMGGVTVPYCSICPTPSFQPSEVDIPWLTREKPQGIDIPLQFIVTADGHPVEIAVAQPIGYGLDAAYRRAVEEWEFIPAVDPDNKSVSVRFHMIVHLDVKKAAPDQHPDAATPPPTN